ncbi:MAG: hypothetical protein MUP36_01995 [Demequinaceae bacterium]|nr:hypothetical protein [Demequinaceae bacterium]
MSRVIEGFEALLLLTLAVTFGSTVQQLREKSKRVTPFMWRAGSMAFVTLAGLVLMKYTGERVIPFLYDRWHLLAYILIVVTAAGLSFFFRKSKKVTPLVWLAIGLASGTGIVLHLFWGFQG